MQSVALTLVALFGIASTELVHLSCDIVGDSQCDTDKYCVWTQNNLVCTNDWHSDQVPTFAECTFDFECDSGTCANNLCCNTSVLPNGEADCPTLEEIMSCCFVHMPSKTDPVYQPPDIDRPPELACGC